MIIEVMTGREAGLLMLRPWIKLIFVGWLPPDLSSSQKLLRSRLEHHILKDAAHNAAEGSSSP
jgi:hypothetical protein